MSEEQTGAAGPDIEILDACLDVTYTWGYQETREKLRNLYEKAQRHQWISEDLLPWQTDVDPEGPSGPEELHPLFGSDIYNKLTEREKTDLQVNINAWTLSQFLHGEQGALLAAAQLVDSVPDLDSKLYGATQVVDEARHVDVYNRYLHEKLGFSFPVSEHLKTLLDLILKDSRWDMKFLGMQIMVEGLALAAFNMIRTTTTEPLLKALTTYVMQDEARHVAYGILSLNDHYSDMAESEVAEREDFVYEAARLMRDRFLFQDVWEKQGLPAERCMEIALHNTGQVMFRQMLFAKIVPAIKRIGLLSDRQRQRFNELGILQFENASDPFEELEQAEANAPRNRRADDRDLPGRAAAKTG
jgi:hypothetical protein